MHTQALRGDHASMEFLDCVQLPQLSITAILAYGILIVYGVHFALDHLFNVAVLSPTELVWDALIFLLPDGLVLDSVKQAELRKADSSSQRFAAKSEALRKMLGLAGNAGLFQKLPAATEAVGVGVRSIIRRTSVTASPPIVSDVPSGLGNWDNSCYQNSVLQALTSLSSLQGWLDLSARIVGSADGSPTTVAALRQLIDELRDSSNNGKYLWTPAKLKNMSSWQQQDAQEYFSKVMDELDKETKKAMRERGRGKGLEALNDGCGVETDCDGVAAKDEDAHATEDLGHNPLEGWIAQRVACTRCGASDGYSMIPFNCLTVPLGPSSTYSLEDCLDEYTRREDIDGVECRRCTLLQAEEKLKKMSAPPSTTLPTDSVDAQVPSPFLSLPPELRAQITQRLQAIQQALEQDDYSDKMIKQTCQISEKAFVSSTKTREAVIGRAPRALVIHINRSVFNEMTGMLSKNYAHVRYPPSLNLQHWMLHRNEQTPLMYRLAAAVTHKGGHENGHYICYKRHPRFSELAKEVSDAVHNEEDDKWYQLSDADVYDASEAEALNPRAGGAFMLFYERQDITQHELDRIKAEQDLVVAAYMPLPPEIPSDFDDLVIETPDPQIVSRGEALSDDDITVDETLPPTVPPSEVSETETDLTDYDSLDPADDEHVAIPLAYPQKQTQHIWRPAPPKDIDAMRDSRTVMSV